MKTQNSAKEPTLLQADYVSQVPFISHFWGGEETRPLASHTNGAGTAAAGAAAAAQDPDSQTDFSTCSSAPQGGGGSLKVEENTITYRYSLHFSPSNKGGDIPTAASPFSLR